MRIRKILICGSTYLSSVCCKYLLENSDYELVGYVPNENRITIPGKMPIPIALKNCKYDILLSIQYDKIIKKTKKAFNFHTGLLPSYGGVDILYHTLKNKEKEQGITFHKITKNLDCGPVISKITYPVAEDDGVEKLYKKLLAIAPFFVLSCLNLLEVMSENEINNCYSMKPKIYKSSQIDLNDRERYKKTGLRLKKIYK